MESTPLSPTSWRRATQACETLVVVAGVAALGGWATGHPGLLGLRPNYVPMAPNTALAFIALGSGLFALVSEESNGYVDSPALGPSWSVWSLS